MALRTPVLATNVGGIPSVVTHGETGWLVPANDPAALAAAFRTLARDEDLEIARLQAGGDVGQEQVVLEHAAAEAHAGQTRPAADRAAHLQDRRGERAVEATGDLTGRAALAQVLHDRGRILDSQWNDRALEPFTKTVRFDLAELRCRPAEITLFTAPNFRIGVTIPAAAGSGDRSLRGPRTDAH